MFPLAKRRLRLWPHRFGIVFAATATCALLAACTEAPKLSKPPESSAETRQIGDARPSPLPQTSQPTEVGQPKAEPQDGTSAGSGDSYRHARHYESSPSGGSAGGTHTAQPEIAQEPSGGAAPPSEMAEPAPPPPPPPAPAAAQPPMPPAAPGAAARAGAEAEIGAAAVRRADEEARAAAAARQSEDAKASAAPPPAPDPAKTYDVVPVFYGTDRAVEADPDRLKFGEERGHKLQLGRALITVPLIHKVPHIERPVVIEIPYFKVKVYEEKEDPQKHFTVQEIKSLTEEQMLALIKERLATSSTFKDHAFVFVHGFNTSFDCALYRTAQIAYDLHFDGVPFLYSWPSGGKVASYTYDHGSVEQAEPLLAEFLKFVIQKSGAKSISLIAHSMGNELLLRVLERLKPQVPPGVVISQVILAAPDVDRDKFNIIAREITGFAKGVTLYAASNDRALGYSARFWGGVPRAGDIPESGPLIIPGVDTIDVTAVSTDALGLNHSGYAENPTLLNDVKALVEYGIRPPDKRIKGVLTVQSAGGTFWRFEASQ